MERPTNWNDFVGQEELKERLKVHIGSATKREEPLDHVLLTGPPGCGKTTLAGIITQELGYGFADFVMPINNAAMKRLVNEHRGIVFMDEIHRCSKKEQESLLSLVEDGYLQLNNGAKIKAHKFFVIIGATTEPDEVIKPLHDRFNIKPAFEEYSEDEMAEIVLRMALLEGLDISDEAVLRLGMATGGIPRNAEELVVMYRDLRLDLEREPTVEEVLSMSKITANGLNRDQVEYLKLLRSSAAPVGVDLIAAQLRLPRKMVISNERLLLRQDLIQYTKAGRELTMNGYKIVREFNVQSA